jgi:hypothetical protein
MWEVLARTVPVAEASGTAESEKRIGSESFIFEYLISKLWVLPQVSLSESLFQISGLLTTFHLCGDMTALKYLSNHDPF